MPCASAVGEMVVLPFQGQQVWRLRFGEEQLAMRTMFDEPRPVDPMGRMTYLNTYGAFLLHCGAMRMGVPGPEDDHPLHGELPNAKYDEAWLDMGEDDQGAYIAVGGEYRHMAAMSHHYTATARATLRDGVQRLPVSMTVHNRHTNPMDLMFMHHANFWPVKGSRLVYSAPSTPDSAKVRTSIPAHVSPTEEYLALLDRLAKDPSLIDNISEELLESASPELVCYYDYLADSDGWAHTMQRLPQGGAHYLKHKPSQMRCATTAASTPRCACTYTVVTNTPRPPPCNSECVRWLTYDESFQALGMALPSTCGPEGYTIEKEKGTVKSLAAGDTAVFDVEAGLLTEADADDVERHIEGILG